jgi:wobble nucleotide-excising tRNase
LEFQEDLLVKENKKIVKSKNAYAVEVEKCENLSRELSICNDSISCLRNENASLNARMFANPLHLLLSMSLFVLDVEMLMLKLLMITLP